MTGNKLQEINLTKGGITTTSPTPLWCGCGGCGGHSRLGRRHSGDAKRLSTARHPEGLRRHSPAPHGAAVVAAGGVIWWPAARWRWCEGGDEGDGCDGSMVEGVALGGGGGSEAAAPCRKIFPVAGNKGEAPDFYERGERRVK
ncbi:hypothetical protein Tco_0683417 [Tanacetum coccineum]|uniref:Uncharacterized protein n=1 Tax=Tanacetum coccineum TaxID=301880 RepID=A0ABQ4XU20_9ASTR